MKKTGKNKVSVHYMKRVTPGFDIKKSVEKLLVLEKQNGLEINIILTDNRFIKGINLEYRLKNRETDVISFPYTLPGNIRTGGDIFISADKAKEQAKECGESESGELARLVVHGALHLIGYDHAVKKDENAMKPKEKKYLKMIMKG